MTRRYTIALIAACIAVLMLAIALAADRLFLAWIVTMFFFVAASMGTDAQLDAQIEEMEREQMLCAAQDRARGIVLQINRDRLWREYLMWEILRENEWKRRNPE